MATIKKRAAALFLTALASVTLLTGCLGGPSKPSSPAEAAVTIQGDMHGVFIHATGSDLPISSPYHAGELAKELDSIMEFSVENGINTVFLDVHDAKGSALYTSDYMPTSELLLDEKGKNTGGDVVYEAVKAGKKHNVQVYAVINPTFIASATAIASEDHPAMRDKVLAVTDENGAVRWNTQKKDAMSNITNIARELAYNYGISGIVLSDDGTDAQALVQVASSVDTALAELGTNKKLGIACHLTAADATTVPAVAAIQQGYTPDFLLADIQARADGSPSYQEILTALQLDLKDKDTQLITVFNSALISSSGSADGKLYADPYEFLYQLYVNQQQPVSGTAINGYTELSSRPYELAALMQSMYTGSADISPYDTTVKPGFGFTTASNDFTVNTAKYFVTAISDPDKPVYFNGQLVERTAGNGIFGILVNLEYGANTFTISQNGTEKTLTIRRPKPSESTGTIQQITQTSMFPTSVAAARVGEELTLKCVAPSGSTVYATVAGKQVQLKQAVATAQNGVAATYTADLIFDAAVSETEVKNLGPITYTLYYGGKTTTYTSSGNLYAVGADAQPVLEVTDYMSGVTVDDTAENAGNFVTTVIEGTRDYIDMSKSSDTHFFLQSGGAIRKETVTLLEGDALTAQSVLEKADYAKVPKGDEFILPGANGVMWHAQMTEKELQVELFNIEDGTLPSVQGSRFDLSAQATPNGTVKLTVTPKDGAVLWGYDITYTEDELILYCKDKPKLSDTPGKPLENVTVLIDPGHGGYDPGALGVAYGFGPTEDGLNMADALATEALLRQLGADVILTLYPEEYTDTKLVLFDRMKIAKEHDADLFISMHHNSTGTNVDSNKSQGLEVYYFTDHSKELAQSIADNICTATGRVNRGIEQSYYVVTKMTYCPAVLTEIGFVVNPAEYEQLADPMVIFQTATGFVKSVFDVLA